MKIGPPLEVKVRGDFACFTRPEMKVERVSYPVMTPSAARGVLEAIFWKPEFHWQVREIAVLHPIRYFSILRNEVASRASARSAIGWEGTDKGYFADEDRQQRHTLALAGVAYIIRADTVLASHAQDENTAKFRDQFRRRVAKGQCHHMPYLGCREFTAFFGPSSEEDLPVDISDDLGQMLFDIDYPPDGSGRCRPNFFHAELQSGVMQIPAELYQSQGE